MNSYFFNFPIGAARTVAPREPRSEKRGIFFLFVTKAIDESELLFLKYGKTKLQMRGLMYLQNAAIID